MFIKDKLHKKKHARTIFYHDMLNYGKWTFSLSCSNIGISTAFCKLKI